MLYKYQKDNEKIVLGILSLSKRNNNVKYLKQELNWYNDSDNRNVYLWKDQFNNWSGVIGIEKYKSCVVIRHIILTPDSNTVFNVFRVLDGIQKMYPGEMIMGTLETQDFITKWERNNERR
ncbi:riboflavin biosynthesis protein RibT [Fructilactobacillus lindneri]|uniref:RibT protein n=2 Tax=Fructilactobacillus lindneri TaxID=53444 RepID=A0A0R2JPA6_9LACO|nr:hypothetical protein [Fructilactobacillus lindneri]ANZ58148.1 riboflavin biosynthesis protein RibT [Fructilactobacillus lindneri]ANZ59469.1 riboflavin biosynthesis protein RibT [Fructilactobacillus lindneri]KRN78969.1 hypothetical protein IV52_GL000373 [Fructilactobacillus lindneri DSM 20690 = JCM 11027]POG98747.1 riboflavin biosynthesis protein RibT [Fructilactobacillus lindneri]POH03020.1 riboflavin biosynthesis protein RibT [Fructilactobacillus lindneri]